MATPTTVLEYAQNARNADAAAKAAALTALQSAQGALATARAALATAAANLVAKEKEVAAKRAELGEADTPAEGAALLADLETLIDEQRVLQLGVVQAGSTVSSAEGDTVVAAAELARLTGELTRAEATLVEAQAADTLRSGWKAAATAAPLDTLIADATTALGEDPYTAVNAKVTADIPAKLLEAATEGFTAEAARAARLQEAADDAETLLMDELEENGGAVGLVVRRRMELERAERALRAWTEAAASRFDRARGLLLGLAGPDPLLNPHEHGGVEALDEQAGQDAADLRIELHSADTARLDAQLDLEEAILAARADDPTVDPATVQEVIDAQGELDDADQALGDARGAFDADAGDFAAWTGEVPDAAWRNLIGWLEADAILQDLSGTASADVTQLVDDVETAEANLAAALDAAEQHTNTVAVLEAYVALRRDRVTRTAATRAARLLSAVRGDA